MSDGDFTFETAGAGASATFPMQAGALRKGGHVMLKGKPCKIVEITTSKTGKHGHAKAHIIGLCIFTEKKCEDLCPSTHNMECPNVTKTEYNLVDIGEEGEVSYLDEKQEIKEDLNMPADNAADKKLSEDIRSAFDDGKQVVLCVQRACGMEKICSFKCTAD